MKSKDLLRYCAATVSRIYWRLAPLWYQHTNEYNVSKPFEQHYVDPKNIEWWTGRESAHLDRIEDLGDIRSGDWDQNGPLDPQQWKSELFYNDRFSNSEFHQSMVEHFCDNVAWYDTTYGDYAINLVNSGEKFRDRSSKCEVMLFLKRIDELYTSIKNNGYLSQRELQQTTQTGRYFGFKRAINNEVCVDISRDGEYLFVDGRHRLSIAKILNIDRIPVTVLVRHKKWVENHGD